MGVESDLPLHKQYAPHQPPDYAGLLIEPEFDLFAGLQLISQTCETLGQSLTEISRGRSGKKRVKFTAADIQNGATFDAGHGFNLQ